MGINPVSNVDTIDSNASNEGEKDPVQEIEHTSTSSKQQPLPDRMPEILRNMTAEERKHLNKRLTRLIDGRLLPFMLLMYILNYLDRLLSRCRLVMSSLC